MSDFDALKLFEQAEQAGKNAEALEIKYQKVCRRVFKTPGGREWLTLAMARMNFMGSVFDSEDGMNPTTAAHRDGMRSVISDILNSAAQAPTTEPND